jgi:hypothetical protein
MADFETTHKHLQDALGPNPNLAPAKLQPLNLNQHKFDDSLGLDRYFLAYLDSATRNWVFSNDGQKLVNAPLRCSLIGPSAEISNTAVFSVFNKQLNYLATQPMVRARRFGSTRMANIRARPPPGLISFTAFFAGSNQSTYSDLSAGQVDQGWFLWAEWMVRTTGASATLQVAGGFGGCYPGALGGFPLRALGSVQADTVDLTTNQGVGIGIQFSVADANNKITMLDAYLDIAPSGSTVS